MNKRFLKTLWSSFSAVFFVSLLVKCYRPLMLHRHKNCFMSDTVNNRFLFSFFRSSISILRFYSLKKVQKPAERENQSVFVVKYICLPKNHHIHVWIQLKNQCVMLIPDTCSHQNFRYTQSCIKWENEIASHLQVHLMQMLYLNVVLKSLQLIITEIRTFLYMLSSKVFTDLSSKYFD